MHRLTIPLYTVLPSNTGGDHLLRRRPVDDIEDRVDRAGDGNDGAADEEGECGPRLGVVRQRAASQAQVEDGGQN